MAGDNDGLGCGQVSSPKILKRVKALRSYAMNKSHENENLIEYRSLCEVTA